MKKGKTYWFTGLSGAGKTTITKKIETILEKTDYKPKRLDGDVVRGKNGLCSHLGFSLEHRKENLRLVANVAKMFNDHGIDVLAAFISPTKSIRNMIKEIIGYKQFNLIYVQCPLEICENRDVKGLYKKARQGIIKDFTGINSPFEEPENPDLILDTQNYDIEYCVNHFLNKFYSFI